MRGLRVLGFCLITTCGATRNQPTQPAGDPNRAVALGEWCKTLTQLMCIRAGSCMGSLEIATSCNDSAFASCLVGHPEDTPSGRSDADLNACVTVFQNAPCDGYMAAVASHVECQVRSVSP